MLTKLIPLLQREQIEYRTEEPMSRHTTFQIGGNCRVMVFPENAEQVSLVSVSCRNAGIPCLVIGNGSNVLVSDQGFDGAVIVMGSRFSAVRLLEDGRIFAQAGAALSKLCHFAKEHACTGFECLYGIPATVGGAVAMNAGAYGGETKDVLLEAQYLDENGKLQTCAGDALDMSYRHSFFTGKDTIITGAYFAAEPGNAGAIHALMEDIYGRRKQKQPLEFPSAGSTFKRPEGAYAAKLIEDCGLKGRTVGAAQVSEKHSGFVINTGGATCSDVLSLIAVIRETVLQKTGIELECEVKIIP